MPWINLTLRRGGMRKEVQHALMAKLTEVLMWWEKVPDTPRARSIMKGWVYELDEDADYNAGSPAHEKPFYFVEIRIPVNRLDLFCPSRALSGISPMWSWKPRSRTTRRKTPVGCG
jgi:hypothetical protein